MFWNCFLKGPNQLKSVFKGTKCNSNNLFDDKRSLKGNIWTQNKKLDITQQNKSQRSNSEQQFAKEGIWNNNSQKKRSGTTICKRSDPKQQFA